MPQGDNQVARNVGSTFVATRTRRIDQTHRHDFYTSEWVTLGAATVNTIDGEESLTVVSMAIGRDSFIRESGGPSRREDIGSVHREISDLARFVGPSGPCLCRWRLVNQPRLER